MAEKLKKAEKKIEKIKKRYQRQLEAQRKNIACNEQENTKNQDKKNIERPESV